MKLSQILRRFVKNDIDITEIINDSRGAKAGALFFCLKGAVSDGHAFAADAYEKGVRHFVAEDKITLPPDAEVFYTDNARADLALAAAEFYGHPAEKLYVIGITGTKGKTSTSFMLRAIFEEAGHKVGVIGTTGIFYGDKQLYVHNSTPDALILHKCFYEMVQCGCDTVVMEASSQGFKLFRTYGITFDAAIYTNLSPDHIGSNEHADFEEYFKCKKQIFKQCKKAFVNTDTDYFEQIICGVACPMVTFGEDENADVRITSKESTSKNGKMCTKFDCVCGGKVHTFDLSMHGAFSIYNAAAAVSVAVDRGIPYSCIYNGLKNVYVEGRMEIVPVNEEFTVIIDYAHNALSCQKLFEAIKDYEHNRIISVFGCSGGRSVYRRYEMGEIIGRNSDICFVTADDPRNEKQEDIFEDIKVGINKTDTVSYFIKDREEAIHKAMDTALPGDIILLLGKGHEHVQEIGDIAYPFCENQIVRDYSLRRHASK